MTQIHISIDRLILDGPDVAPEDVPRLVAVMERELKTLLSSDSSSDSSTLTTGGATDSATDYIRAPELSMKTPCDPAVLGRDLARSLASAIKGVP